MNLQKLEILAGQTFRELVHVRRFNNSAKDPQKTQEQKLLEIVRKNRDTAFGKKHSFNRVNSIRDFQNCVPSSSYEDLFPYIAAEMNGEKRQLTAEDPFMFATTSGTTNKPKFIPITPDHLRDYTHAFQIYNYQMAKDHPEAAMGRYLIIASNDEEGRTAAGIPYGAVSGVLNKRQPDIIKKFFAVPYQVNQIKDVNAKYYSMMRIALNQNVTSIFCCNPSSLLLLADMLQESGENLIADIFNGGISKGPPLPDDLREALNPYLQANPSVARRLSKIIEKEGKLTPREVWPNLDSMSCWKGGPLGFYIDQLSDIYGNIPIRDFGYMASEGRGSIPISDQGAGGVLAITSHFFEFVAEEDSNSASPTFLTAEMLELGRRYFIYFTTSAGLYRYNINDLIEVVGFFEQTPVIQFIRKGAGFSSITGEKLTEEQVRVALSAASAQMGLVGINHFSTGVELGRPPRYVCYIESKDALSLPLQQQFLALFDFSLKEQNSEYMNKRESRRLGNPTLQELPLGTRAKIVQFRVSQGAPEAQVKIPLLLRNDDAMLNELREAV